ncbi:MAG: hypothetical protein BGN99_14080 [Alphaproteobacteria bacterium 65-37]|jgi:hypothetical protein|nr:MAG: hypothetical protein BGN99_14080 [Alphaproteobacteria bacterium 65-37]
MSGLFGDVTWLAQRHGQDWRDDLVDAAVRWLVAQVPDVEWRSRAFATETRFQAAKAEWAKGRRVPLFDPEDAVAWYVHQARCYADPVLRPDFFEPEGYRIAPLFRRLGQLLPSLQKVTGADERAYRMMTDRRSRPDDSIYELLVAGAYRLRGWTQVVFVPETPKMKRPDLFVDRGHSHWAVECKRAGRSDYSREERLAGERMAAGAHEVSREASRPLAILARFTGELHELGDDYLHEKAIRFIERDEPYEWEDEGGAGAVMDVPWQPLQYVLEMDDIYFGSSRMVELLLGRYDPAADYSVRGDWEPGVGRPFHATAVGHVSIVGWISTSIEAERRKAQHFRGVVGRASGQLPGDRPGVIHVGYETTGGNGVDALRHRLNRREMRTFEPGQSRLRLVYGNYFMPEHVTARNESAAVTETTALYPVGHGGRREQLVRHLLFSDEDGQPGAHFVR